jgi:glycosyltransferase involved in cell wall biosynthesis
MNQPSLSIVSHNYFHPQWQEKLPFLLASFSRISILQPHLHKSIEKTYRLQLHHTVSASNIRFYSFRAILLHSVTFCTFINPLRFIWILIQEAPSIILLEEDPHSSIGILVLISLFVLKGLRIHSKLVLFTWDNLNRKPTNVLSSFLKKAATLVASKCCDGLICGNTEAQKIAFEDKKFTCNSVVLPLLAAPSKPSLHFARSFPKHRLRVGYVGRIVPEKGISTLLDACHLLTKSHNIELLVVGSGPYLEFYKSYLPHSAHWLSFIGYVPFDKVYEYLDLIDILVLPSIDTPLWKEQFGLVLAQAMSIGIPCVGSDSGAIPDVINDPALIFRQGNAHSLYDLLSQLISSRDLYEYSSRSALNRAAYCFSPSSVGASYSAFLTSVMNDSSAVIQTSPYSPILID